VAGHTLLSPYIGSHSFEQRLFPWNEASSRDRLETRKKLYKTFLSTVTAVCRPLPRFDLFFEYPAYLPFRQPLQWNYGTCQRVQLQDILWLISTVAYRAARRGIFFYYVYGQDLIGSPGGSPPAQHTSTLYLHSETTPPYRPEPSQYPFDNDGPPLSHPILQPKNTAYTVGICMTDSLRRIWGARLAARGRKSRACAPWCRRIWEDCTGSKKL